MKSVGENRAGTTIRFRHFEIVKNGDTYGQGNSLVVVGGSDPDHYSSGAVVAMSGPMETKAIFDPETAARPTEPGAGVSAVAWPAIWAGAATTVATSVLFLALGSGFGLLEGSAWPGLRPSATKFVIAAGLWLIVSHWLSSALGGYMAGRLRVRWHGLDSDEVFFRDTAHGFLTWATGTVIVGVVSVLALALTGPEIPPATDMAPEMVEQMRKAAAAFSLFTAIAMLVGAFVASAAGAIGGRLRDLHP
jgi:hypothetical protein